MISLKTILTEEVIGVFECEVLIRTSKDQNKVYIYNEIRGLKDVVVVHVEKNDYLARQSTTEFEYSLLRIKYLSRESPEKDIKKITLDSKTTSKIPGLLQFMPRMKTIKKIGQY